ncbi:hypothetical protein, conserved in T. vivax [Trypanosoma vivax Y486]|uniref:Uncharacterized protein n=1 Tax=Trypanosoma vivax (strain Y486) TaxID=1055687 RepID=F9WNV3_TRYVY|nr:hypothetical protein, conserved in T. vivax [Trypanosoma vivax Y486]|eukprot:CCD19224.1 hypothetical protein, conserved in T. vivax [Trypanosoma vivax Y486]
MCAAVTVAHHAPLALPPLTHDTAIQRPAARAPFRLPPFKTPTCFPSTHRYSSQAASAPGQLGLRQLGDPARQVSTLAPRAERRKSHGDGDLFGLPRMASSARHLASAGGPRAFDQTGINRSETRLSVNVAPSLHTQCSTANAIKDHSPAALSASRVLVQCTQVTCRSVGCLHRGRHVGQCLISCATATHRKTKLPAGKWYTLSQRSAETHCWTKGQPCHGDSKTQKAWLRRTLSTYVDELIGERGQAAGCLQNHKAAEKATLLTMQEQQCAAFTSNCGTTKPKTQSCRR